MWAVKWQDIAKLTDRSPADIVRLDVQDAEELHELLKVTWEHAYEGLLPAAVLEDAARTWHSADTLRRQMKNTTVLFAGCREGGRLVGMVRAAMVDETTLRVFQLYVMPDSQRHGIGKALMDHAIRSFPGTRRVVLDVVRGNEKGIAFYRKYGFRFVSESTLRLGESEIHNIDGILDL